MELLAVILSAIFFSVSSGNGCNEARSAQNSSGTDGIVLTVTNNWTIPSGFEAVGLDILENGTDTQIVSSDHINNNLGRWLCSTGVYNGSISLHEENDHCYGIAFNNAGNTMVILTNDWYHDVFYSSDDSGGSWTTFTNPAGNQSRGMDFDGTDYWTTDGTSGGLWRFQPGGDQQFIEMPGFPDNLLASGLAVWNYMGSTAIAVTSCSNHNIWIYIWNGSSLSFSGSAPCPVDCEDSYGLAYSETNDRLYWSYFVPIFFYQIAEISIDITSLSRDTWAGIKTSF